MHMRARGTDRLLDVLDLLAAQQRPTTRNSIAAALGAPRSTVYSIIDTLLARGFLDQTEPEGLIVPGRLCGLLGQVYDRSAPLARQAKEVVTDLAKATGEVSELDVLQDWKQLILISRTGRGHGYRTAVEGSRFPLPATAAARFLLDGYSLDDLRRSIPAEDYVSPTGRTSTPEILHQEVAEARRQGHWVTKGLVDPYVACVTAPVRSCEGRCIAVICLVVPLQEIDRREAEYVAATTQAAAKLSSDCALLENPAF
ncbi:IclR family transcriptional regulator [Rhizobium oryzicola]|uniref:IclR family transcriptional regulator C-terminal domain-containing protein n=1 Tax=Rhizobium oryzicola TaxID=1232668 RepID=A0ABT8SXV0_9HYPH|nr:IclR family transcriptional regulator C-terminal domain-containing protein [Rhizobium oryzicola]MDO1582713.1 IclR family transcriptional regulator C-terminal domain-containing protein [Rhizobium oryzicola]